MQKSYVVFAAAVVFALVSLVNSEALAQATPAGTVIEGAGTARYRYGNEEYTTTAQPARTIVEAAYDLSTLPTPENQTAAPGTTAYYSYSITNRANCRDTIRIIAARVEGETWTLTIVYDGLTYSSPLDIYLDQDQTAQFSIGVTPPAEAVVDTTSTNVVMVMNQGGLGTQDNWPETNGRDSQSHETVTTCSLPPLPTADFTGTPTTGEAPLTVTFTDASTPTGSIISWYWDFGSDASPATANTQGPHSVTYSTAGTKTVILTVTSPGGEDTETKTDYITVTAPILTIYVDGTNGLDSNGGSSWTDAKQTIQRGIDAATGDYYRVLVADGIYTGTYNRNLNFVTGRNITLLSLNGAANCTIDAGGTATNRGFNITVATTSVIDGFTITRGDAGTSYGGGVYCTGSGTNPTFTNCTISSNRAGNGGGGVSSRTASSPIFINCIISGNNGVSIGGNVYCDGANPIFTNCTISSNTAAPVGGGVYCTGASNPIFTNCTISGNTSGSNSASIFCTGAGANPAFTNCIISGNIGSSNGGGVRCEISASPIFTNCTISGNRGGTGTSYRGGGVYCTGASPTFRNCIIWGNAAGASTGKQIYGTGTHRITLSYCCYPEGDVDIVAIRTADDCITAVPTSSPTYPLFVEPLSPGLNTGGNYRLQAASPCIDRGNNALIPAGITTDIDSNPRISPVDGTVDIGAYEYQHP